MFPPCMGRWGGALFPGFSKKLLTTNDNKNPYASWITQTGLATNRVVDFFTGIGSRKTSAASPRTLTGFAAGAPAAVHQIHVHPRVGLIRWFSYAVRMISRKS